MFLFGISCFLILLKLLMICNILDAMDGVCLLYLSLGSYVYCILLFSLNPVVCVYKTFAGSKGKRSTSLYSNRLSHMISHKVYRCLLFLKDTGLVSSMSFLQASKAVKRQAIMNLQ